MTPRRDNNGDQASSRQRTCGRRAADADSAAFGVFVERHQAAVLRLLRVLTDNEADAEDALQEAFLAAWRSAAALRGSESARGWILTIARNALHRQHRRRAGEPSDFESLDARS